MTQVSDPGVDILELIELRAPTLSTAERAIAEAILSDPAAASQKTIGQLAQEAGSSEATVTRFCKSIGVSGYPHLRLRLAVAEERRRSGSGEGETGIALLGELDPEDTISTILRKVAAADARAIEVTLNGLDQEALSAVVDALVRAPRIMTFGVAASATAACDATAKLNLAGRAAHVAHDVHTALMVLTNFSASDLVLAFSHSGRARDVVDLLTLARERGVASVVVTSDGASPAARVADHVLLTAAREVTFRSGGIASRMAQLAVVDALFVVLAHRRFELSVASAEAMHESVASYVIGTEKGRR